MKAGEHVKRNTFHKYIFFINLFIYLLFICGCVGPLGCTGFPLVVVSQGYSLAVVCGLLQLQRMGSLECRLQ